MKLFRPEGWDGRERYCEGNGGCRGTCHPGFERAGFRDYRTEPDWHPAR